METDLILSAIDEIHKQTDVAFEKKDISAFMHPFDENLKYTTTDASTYNKKELTSQTEKYFRNTKEIQTSHYRIKSSLNADVFTEKIARKSVVQLKKLLFTKKQTIQTEEIFTWEKAGETWKVIQLEVILEEKY